MYIGPVCVYGAVHLCMSWPGLSMEGMSLCKYCHGVY